MRVAAIDIGTNSVLLSIARRDADGALQLELDRCTITRLGQGVDKTRRLDPNAVERTLACLADYAKLLRSTALDRLEVVGTSALRDVEASEDFLERATALLGVRPRVIAGTLEAELSFDGALSALGLSGPVVVVDVGGGSTEVICGRVTPRGSQPEQHASLDVGCVRMTERHVDGDPPSDEALSAIQASTRNALSRLGFRSNSGPLVAVAGTATTLAAVELGLQQYDGTKLHGHAFSRERLEALVRRLSKLTSAQRSVLPGMEARRADVIVAGGVILMTVLREFGNDGLIVSDRGVRYGLLESMLA